MKEGFVMYLRCGEILQLPSLKELILVAGKEGLDKIITWFHVVEIPETAHWVKGGELLFITGIGIKNPETELVALIKSINDKGLAGLVVNIGPYIKHMPNEAIVLADKLNFPLFELPYQVKLIDITLELGREVFTRQIEEKNMSDLVKELIYKDFDSSQEIEDRASYYGYNLKTNYQAVILDIDNFSQYIKNNNLKEEKIIDIKNNFVQSIQSVLYSYGKGVLHMLISDSIFILLPCPEDAEPDFSELFTLLNSKLSEKLPKISVSMGIGNSASEMKYIRRSIDEARKALQFMKTKGDLNSIIQYKDIGIFKLFFELDNNKTLEKFYKETLNLLIDYDEKHGSELYATFKVYLGENKNTASTSKKLFIHRNTLKYRLEKIEDLLNFKLSDNETCFNYQFAFKVSDFILSCT